MAVNEDLYSWLLKTQGMPAAEWYRNNPTKPHTSNPHVPPGAAKWFPQASTGGSDNTYASVSPEIIEASVIEPASTGDYFQQFLNSLDSGQRADIEGMGDLTEEDKREIGYNYAAQQKLGISDSPFANYQKDSYGNYRIPTSDPLVSYDPDWGDYGGYVTKEDLGFSPTSVLYKRYEDWTKNNPVPDQETMVLRAIRNDPTLGGTAGYNPDGSYYRLSLDSEDLRKLAEYDAAVAARSKAFEDLYKTPLSQIQYKSFSEAPSLQAFRNQFSSLGIDIPLMSNGGYFVRRATEQDPEVQQFGIYNVGRQDYRQARINEGTQKNIELLKQQAEQGIPSSAEYLRDYLAEKQQLGSDAPLMPLGGDAPRMPLGGNAPGPRGPRGEELGEVAWNTPAIPMGPYTPVRNYGTRTNPSYAPSTRDTHNNPGGARVTPIQFVQENQPVDVRVARAAEKSDEQRERLAQQSEFDLSKEKQLASAKAADAYRRSAANEDPFRAAARVG